MYILMGVFEKNIHYKQSYGNRNFGIVLIEDLCSKSYIDGLVQERRNFFANAQGWRLFCTNPSTYVSLVPNYSDNIGPPLLSGKQLPKLA